MNYVDADLNKLAAMAGNAQDEAVVMLNLLKYRDVAEPGYGVDGLTGEQAYRIYGEKFAGLNARFGGEPIWMGKALNTIIGSEDWDIAILVAYPTRKQFVEMFKDPDYSRIAPIRGAALQDSRLVEMSQLLPKTHG
ncbi:MAG: DUF1330 domain-containing protein [Pseudomonadales bacterium]|nr:DUF1330 domain-containing protein [Pseudomonadales bacterium]MDG1442111.1 DUF1330 domain-containing protein [Pseudomonadales bacterium]